MAYFETAKRGELQEMQNGLNSKSLEDKRLALKKVIAQMTLGKDLSPLFQSVIKCLEFQELDIKKLVLRFLLRFISTSSITPELNLMMLLCPLLCSERMLLINLTLSSELWLLEL